MNLNELYNLDVADIRRSAARALSTGRIVDQTADYLRLDVKNIPKLWKGPDADTAGVTLTQHAERLETAGQAVRKAHKILDRLAGRLDREHRGVKAYVDSVNRRVGLQAEGYYVIDIATGDVTGGPGTTDAGAAAVRDGYLEFVNRATAADAQAASALAGIDELDKAAEAGNAFTGLDGKPWDADTEDAATAGDLLNQARTTDLSKADQHTLRGLVSQNRDDRQFATDLLNRLGAKGFLEAYGSVVVEKGGLTAGFQQDMSRLLAAATERSAPGEPGHPIVAELVRLIGTDVSVDSPREGGPSTVSSLFGSNYQVPAEELVGPLLSHGDFDADAILPLANTIYEKFVAQEAWKNAQAHTNNWSRYLNATDPVRFTALDGAMRGLANSTASRDPSDPDHGNAAQKFLDPRQHPGRIEHILGKTVDPAKYAQFGHDGFDWQNLFNSGFDHAGGRMLNGTSTARLLEAAAIGRDLNDPYWRAIPERGEEMARITERIIAFTGTRAAREQLGTNDPDLKNLRRSLANIALFSARDLYRASHGNGELWTDMPVDGVPLTLVPDGGHDAGAAADPPSHHGFLTLIGRDRESRILLTGTFDRLSREHLLRTANNTEDLSRSEAEGALLPHARLEGALNRGEHEARQAGVDQVNLTDEQFDDIYNLGAGVGTGVVAGAAIAGPLGSVVGGVIGFVASKGIEANTEDDKAERFASLNETTKHNAISGDDASAVPGRSRRQQYYEDLIGDLRSGTNVRTLDDPRDGGEAAKHYDNLIINLRNKYEEFYNRGAGVPG